MKFSITAKPTWRDVLGRFSKAEKALLNARRNELRNEARGHIIPLMQKKIRAKVAPYDAESLTNRIKFNTRVIKNDVRLNVTAPAQAGPHRIRASRAGALSFFFAKIGRQTIVPRRGGFKTHVRSDGTLFVGKGYVDHPGGSLEPLLGPIMEASSNEWLAARGQKVLARMSTRYTDSLTK